MEPQRPSILSHLRLDDLFALGAICTFGVLSAVTSAELINPSVLNFLALLLYYGLMGGLAWFIADGSRLRPLLQRGLLLSLVAVVFALTVLLPDGDRGLDVYRNFLTLAFPILAVALYPSPRGSNTGVARGLSLLRDWSPYIISVVLYLSLHDVVSQVNPTDRDDLLIAADEAIFGGHASVWLERFVSPPLTEWMAANYSLYVFFPLTLGLLLQRRGDRARFLHLMQASILTSWLGFVGYLLVPAVGPMYTLSHLYQQPLTGGVLFELKENMDLLRVPRDCFPSLHTAHTLVVLVGAFLHSWRVGLMYLPFCLSCIAATLYLRYHYAIDVVAGALLAVFCLLVTPPLHRAWQRAVGAKVE